MAARRSTKVDDENEVDDDNKRHDEETIKNYIENENKKRCLWIRTGFKTYTMRGYDVSTCFVSFGTGEKDSPEMLYNFKRQFTLSKPTPFHMSLFAALLGLERVYDLLTKEDSKKIFSIYQAICLSSKHRGCVGRLEFLVGAKSEFCSTIEKRIKARVLALEKMGIHVCFVHLEASHDEKNYEDCDDDPWQEEMTCEEDLDANMRKLHKQRLAQAEILATDARIISRKSKMNRGKVEKMKETKKKKELAIKKRDKLEIEERRKQKKGKLAEKVEPLYEDVVNKTKEIDEGEIGAEHSTCSKTPAVCFPTPIPIQTDDTNDSPLYDVSTGWGERDAMEAKVRASMAEATAVAERLAAMSTTSSSSVQNDDDGVIASHLEDWIKKLSSLNKGIKEETDIEKIKKEKKRKRKTGKIKRVVQESQLE